MTKRTDYDAWHAERVRTAELKQQQRAEREAQLPGLERALRIIHSGLAAQGWKIETMADLAAVPGSVIYGIVEAEFFLALDDAAAPAKGPRLDLEGSITIKAVLDGLSIEKGAAALTGAAGLMHATARKRIIRERERQGGNEAAGIALLEALLAAADRMIAGLPDDSPQAKLLRAHVVTTGHSIEAIAAALRAEFMPA